MKSLLTCLLPILCLHLLFSFGQARDEYTILAKYQPPQIFYNDLARSNRVIQRGNVWMNLTNWGFLGNWNHDDEEALENPAFPGTWAPQGEFPGGSGIQYLFMGSPWIGALVQQGDSVFARVSCGTEGWTGPDNNQFEFNPGEADLSPIEEHGMLERSSIPGAVNYLGEPIYSTDALAHQEFISVYTDTLADILWTGEDIIDGPHFPLGLRVTQKARVWDTQGFEDFVILEYVIENIGSYDLKNLYLGYYIDGDVGWIGEEDWHIDDVTGFLQVKDGDTLNLPYIADNDGRPEDVQWGSDFTCPGVSGLYLLDMPADLAYISYNWWISYANPDLDFGPCWVDDEAPENWTDTLGTPNGDERKYFLMTNKEIDYDQWYEGDEDWILFHPQVFTDPFTGEVSTHAWKIEDYSYPGYWVSYDARYLISIGPFGENVSSPGEEPETYFYPGDSLKFTFAYVCGDGFHDPENPQGYPFDPDKPVYDDLVYNCLQARYLYESNFSLSLPYSPQNFHIAESYDDSIRFTWDAYSTMPEVEVNIFRHTEGAQYDTIPLNDQPIDGSTFVDTNVTGGQAYYFRAQAVLDDSILSCFSNEIAVVVGAPLAPGGLEASGLNEVVLLSWDSNSEPDLNHYNIYRGDTTGILEHIGEALGIFEHYADTTVDNGNWYTYVISAVDHDGYESFSSDTVTVSPMGLYKPLLVIRERTDDPLGFEWPDSVLENFYDQFFTDIGETPDFLTPSVSSPGFPGLPELSAYEVVWIINDMHANSSFAYFLPRNNILIDYLLLGGRVIVSGRKIFIGSFGTGIGWSDLSLYPSLSILVDYFKISSVCAISAESLFYPFTPGSPDFKAATPSVPEYPAVQVDTSKCDYWPTIPDWIYLVDIDGMVPTDEGEILYTYESAWPDTSLLHGMAVGIRSTSPTVPSAILTFPLYAMEPYDSVKALASRILEDIRSISVGEPPSPEPPLPVSYVLKQNYPNPFNAQTVIEFEVPYMSSISLNIYDIQGRLVATLLDRPYPEGKHRISFDGADLASGIYFARLTAGDYHETKKMVLLK